MITENTVFHHGSLTEGRRIGSIIARQISRSKRGTLVHCVGNVLVQITLQSHANSCVEVGFLHSSSQFSLAFDQAMECPLRGVHPAILLF